MIFLMEFGINKHLQHFQRQEIAPPPPPIFASLENLLVLIYSTLNSQ